MESNDETVENAALLVTVASRSGALRMTATEQGLPVRLDVDAEQLQRDPDVLARDLLRLCRQAAQRAGLQRRIQMTEQGVPAEVIDRFGHPRPEDVAREEILDDEDDYEPTSWMRPL